MNTRTQGAVAIQPSDLTQERLKSLLDYDANSGLFVWKVYRGRMAKAGYIAGTPIQGRIHIKIDGRHYYAHRLAFLFMQGQFPSDEVDHVDGDPSNNAWVNLRACSHSENMQNRRVSATSKSGLLGASPHGEAWIASITVGKKRVHIGRFADREEAHAAYLAAKSKLHSFNPDIAKERAGI